MHTRVTVSLVAAALILAACTSQTESTATPDAQDPPGGSITESPPPAETDLTPAPADGSNDEEWMATLGAIDSYLNSTRLDDNDESRERVAQFLRNQSGVAEAAVSPDGTVWAQFTDGRQHFVFLNRETVWTETSPGASLPSPVAGVPLRNTVASAAGALSAAAAGGAAMPASNVARFMNGLGPGYTAPPSKIKEWLEESGYQPAETEPTVNNLKTLAGDGILFLRTHGGCGGRTADGQQTCGLFTSTPVTDFNNALYREDIDAGRLRTGSARQRVNHEYDPMVDDPANGLCRTDEPESSELPICAPETLSDTNYVITEAFIEFYWTAGFAENSLIVFDFCTSAEMVDTVLGLPGTTAFAGWTGNVNNQTSDSFNSLFFDRLLGINQEPPDEFPDVRPFDVGAVGEYMQHKDRYNDPEQPTTQYLIEDTGTTILVPSIEVMEVFEDSDELWINGLFGAEKGEVTINKQTATVVKWEPELVVVKLDDTGAGAAGDVQVALGKHESNEVPLTEWSGRITYETTSEQPAPCLRADIGMDVHLRADIHSSRKVPWEPPAERQVAFVLAGDSKAAVTMTGSCSMGGAQFTLTGGASLPTISDQPDDELGHFEMNGILSVPASSAPPTVHDVNFHLHVTGGNLEHGKLTISGSGMPTQTTHWPIPQTDVLFDQAFQLDTEYNIMEGNLKSGSGLPSLAKGTLRWKKLEATHEPSLADPPPA